MLRIIGFVYFLLIFVACSSDEEVNVSPDGFQYSGSLKSEGNVTVTDSTNLYVMWVTPDQVRYFSDKGKIENDNWELTIDKNIPDSALMEGIVGVGYFVLVDGEVSMDQNISVPTQRIRGASEERYLVYLDEDYPETDTIDLWSQNFERGLSLAKGVKNDSSSFVDFVPVEDGSEIEITVAGVEELELVNWF